MAEHSQWEGKNRRKTPLIKDGLYRWVIGINVVTWLLFLAAMIVFHYARPELISGVQEFWGLEGRQNWSDTLSFYLVLLLSLCTVLSAVTLALKRKRNRRKNDYFGVNVLFLLAITLASLTWIYLEVN